MLHVTVLQWKLTSWQSSSFYERRSLKIGMSVLRSMFISAINVNGHLLVVLVSPPAWFSCPSHLALTASSTALVVPSISTNESATMTAVSRHPRGFALTRLLGRRFPCLYQSLNQQSQEGGTCIPNVSTYLDPNICYRQTVTCSPFDPPLFSFAMAIVGAALAVAVTSVELAVKLRPGIFSFEDCMVALV